METHEKEPSGPLHALIKKTDHAVNLLKNSRLAEWVLENTGLRNHRTYQALVENPAAQKLARWGARAYLWSLPVRWGGPIAFSILAMSPTIVSHETADIATISSQPGLPNDVPLPPKSLPKERPMALHPRSIREALEEQEESAKLAKT